jgi:hypothetical protein
LERHCNSFEPAEGAEGAEDTRLKTVTVGAFGKAFAVDVLCVLGVLCGQSCCAAVAVIRFIRPIRFIVFLAVDVAVAR